jgi:hypothetical protein
MSLFKLTDKKGQSTTEVVLILPILMLILFFTAKIFALLVMVQKVEIASYYAARRWQLESHVGSGFEAWDEGLRRDIKNKVMDYLGFGGPLAGFLQLSSCILDVERAQALNVITLIVEMSPPRVPFLCRYPSNVVCAQYGAACYRGYDYLCVSGAALRVDKYVPNRDWPLDYFLRSLTGK